MRSAFVAQPLRAARAAFWTGFRSMTLGEIGRANGWLARAQRLVDDHPDDCAERGLLLLPVAFRLQRTGKDAEVHDIAMRVAAIGDRLNDADRAQGAKQASRDHAAHPTEAQRHRGRGHRTRRSCGQRS